MIKVIKKNNVIEISGHAGYDEFGKDIVCASVSSVIMTTVNSIMNIDNLSISYVDDKDKIIIVNEVDEVYDKLKDTTGNIYAILNLGTDKKFINILEKNNVKVD